jgi:acetylornithine deacetylase
MRLWTAKGIPTVMCGTRGIERAHAVDEFVEIAEVERLAELVRQVVERF